MTQTNAKRQAAYRSARAGGGGGKYGSEGERRINIYVRGSAFSKLATLAKRRGTSKRQVLEDLIAAAWEAI